MLTTTSSDTPNPSSLDLTGLESAYLPQTYGDAVVKRPYSETDYLQPITVTLGTRTDSKAWRPEEMPLGLFLARLVQHKEGKKDGPAWVGGDMVPGPRLKNSVKSLHFIGLDIDVGTPSDVVDAAIDKLGCAAVRYSTHSAFKTVTEFKKDKLAKHANGAEVNDELIRRFLLEDQKWDASIANYATYGGSDHTEKGLVHYVQHPPIPKHRIVIPLEAPYVINDEGNTQKEATDKWAKVIAAMRHTVIRTASLTTRGIADPAREGGRGREPLSAWLMGCR